MGNFRYRLATSIDFLAHHLKAIERLDDVEILITDWNSDTPLSKELSLSYEAAQICRFVHVPPQIARLAQPEDVAFHMSKATNAGIRRGTGQFIMLFDADSLISRFSVKALLDLVGGELPVPFSLKETYFFSGRYQIPWEIVQRQPSIKEWERYLMLNSGQLPPDSRSHGLGVFGIGLMMHRSLWHRCQGYDERLTGWGWSDADLMLRLTQFYPWIDLASIGISIFHMEHHDRARRLISPHSVNPYTVSPTLTVNDVHWGLGDEELSIHTVEKVGAVESDEHPGSDPRVARWDKTRKKILAEMASPNVRKQVRNNLISMNVKTTEWGSLYALAWFGLFQYPRNYLEFGARNPNATGIVVTACPGTELYLIDSWQKDGTRAAPPPSFITSVLEQLGHRGYSRFISGDIKSAWKRLKGSFIGDLALDLVFVRGDLLGEDGWLQIADIVEHLAPGGAMILTYESKAVFEAAWIRVKNKFPHLTFIQCIQRNTGIAVAAVPQEGEPEMPILDEEYLLDNAWTRVLFTKSYFAIWRKRIASVWEEIKRQSPKRWPRILYARWMAFRERWRIE